MLFTVLKTLSRLPLPLLYLLADAIFVIAYYGMRWRRDVVDANLRDAFPEHSEAERRHIGRRFYRHLAEVTVEALKAHSLSPAQLNRRVRIVNPQALEAAAQSRHSVILMAAHHCNWEWLLLASCTQLPLPIRGIYKPVRHPDAERFMYETRSRFGGVPVPIRNAIPEMIKHKGEAIGYAIVADQTPLQSEEKYWTRFLNQDTAFFVGADKIAKLTRSPVFFVAMKRIRRGHYEVSLQPLAQPPYTQGDYQIIERYARAAEKQIVEHPTDWLWLYRRWKYKKPLYA